VQSCAIRACHSASQTPFLSIHSTPGIASCIGVSLSSRSRSRPTRSGLMMLQDAPFVNQEVDDWTIVYGSSFVVQFHMKWTLIINLHIFLPPTSLLPLLSLMQPLNFPNAGKRLCIFNLTIVRNTLHIKVGSGFCGML
jgi:hypothetical protein